MLTVYNAVHSNGCMNCLKSKMKCERSMVQSNGNAMILLLGHPFVRSKENATRKKVIDKALFIVRCSLLIFVRWHKCATQAKLNCRLMAFKKINCQL
jgi:hypothetical protein